MDSALVRSKMLTPCRSQAAARPCTSLAGWIAAQSSVYVAPRVRVASRMAVASGALSSERSDRPQASASATSARARTSWAFERAREIVPPRAYEQSMFSSAATRPTSRTEPRIASCWARALDRDDPGSAASEEREAGKSAEHQPPFRPDAPNPTCSASRTAIRSDELVAR